MSNTRYFRVEPRRLGARGIMCICSSGSVHVWLGSRARLQVLAQDVGVVLHLGADREVHKLVANLHLEAAQQRGVGLEGENIRGASVNKSSARPTSSKGTDRGAPLQRSQLTS